MMLGGAALRGLCAVAQPSSSSGYPARGGHSTHEWPRTSHPLSDDLRHIAHALSQRDARRSELQRLE